MAHTVKVEGGSRSSDVAPEGERLCELIKITDAPDKGGHPQITLHWEDSEIVDSQGHSFRYFHTMATSGPEQWRLIKCASILLEKKLQKGDSFDLEGLLHIRCMVTLVHNRGTAKVFVNVKSYRMPEQGEQVSAADLNPPVPDFLDEDFQVN